MNENTEKILGEMVLEKNDYFDVYGKETTAEYGAILLVRAFSISEGLKNIENEERRNSKKEIVNHLEADAYLMLATVDFETARDLVALERISITRGTGYGYFSFIGMKEDDFNNLVSVDEMKFLAATRSLKAIVKTVSELDREQRSTLESLPSHTIAYSDQIGMQGVKIFTPSGQIVDFGGRPALERFGVENQLSERDTMALRMLDAQADKYRSRPQYSDLQAILSSSDSYINIPFKEKKESKRFEAHESAITGQVRSNQKEPVMEKKILSEEPGIKPVAMFFAGPIGAGKSSLRSASNDDRIFLDIDRDKIAAKLPGGANEDNRLKASIEANKLFENAIKQGKSFSMETSLSTPDSLQKIRAAKAAGYEVELRFIGVASPDLAVARVQDRVKRGGHGFDETYIRNSYISSLKNLPEAVRLADRASVLDNSKLYKPTNYLNYEGSLSQHLKKEESPAWIKDAAVRIAQRKTEMMPKNSYETSNGLIPAIGVPVMATHSGSNSLVRSHGRGR